MLEVFAMVFFTQIYTSWTQHSRRYVPRYRCNLRIIDLWLPRL